MKKIIAIIIIISCWFYSCKKEYDQPPLKEVNDGARITIKKLKERLISPLSNYYKFNGGDTNLYCTVISDEISGNFYGQVFVRDEEGGAIQLNLKESGGLYTGDKIRINLNTIYLVSANGMIYLDSVDVTKNVAKLSSGNQVVPKTVSMDDILLYSTSPTHSNSVQSQLVQLNGVEFITNTLVPTFADAIGKTSVNQTITACAAGKVLTVRTSGRCNFAAKLLPHGNGSIIGIVSQYNSTMQLTIREYNDVKMTGPPCATPTNTQTAGALLVKDFNDNSITSGSWTSCAVTNSAVSWSTGTSSLVPTAYARISGYAGGNTNAENWLISPAVDLTKANEPILTFKTAAKFSGTPLDVLISANYVSGDPGTATWTSLSPNYALSPTSGDYLWTFSGNIPLSSYKFTSTRIAFKYKSTAAGATNYQLDDITIKEK
jgi:hypothetical protein